MAAKYSREYPKRMYVFFKSYADQGAPSFIKFAESIGVTYKDLEGFRAHAEFDRSYRECSEIRRDYLIDQALSKRHDASFSKFLITLEYTDGENASVNEDFNLTLEVRE